MTKKMWDPVKPKALRAPSPLAEAQLKSGIAAHMAATGELPSADGGPRGADGDPQGWVDYDPQGEQPPVEVLGALKSAATPPVASAPIGAEPLPLEKPFDPFARDPRVGELSDADAEYLRGEPLKIRGGFISEIPELKIIGPGLLVEDDPLQQLDVKVEFAPAVADLRCLQCRKKKSEVGDDVCVIYGSVAIRHAWAGIL